MWSAMRHAHTDFLAEILGVFMMNLITLSAGFSCLAVGCAAGSTSIASGAGTMIGVYLAGTLSGGHLNPNFTITCCTFRRFPWSKAPKYIIGQFLGNVLSCAVVYSLQYSTIHHFQGEKGLAITSVFIGGQKHYWVDPATAFFGDFIASLMSAAAMTAISVADPHTGTGKLGRVPVVAGLVAAGVSFAFSDLTGGYGNPARDLTARTFLYVMGHRDVGETGTPGGTGLFTNPYWAYGWLASFAGTLAGTAIHDLCLGQRGSPISKLWGPPGREESSAAAAAEAAASV